MKYTAFLGAILVVIASHSAFAENCTIDFSSSSTGVTKFWGRSGGRVLLYYQGSSTYYCSNVGASDTVLIYGSAYADSFRPCSVAGSGCSAYAVPQSAWGYFQVIGGAGNDILACDTIPCQMDGGPGDDNLAGGTGDDVLNGDDGCDFLDGWGGDDLITVGAVFGSDGCVGTQTAVDYYGSNVVIGSNGVDYISVGQYGVAASNTVYGLAGDDQISAIGGTLLVDGGSGNDTISIGAASTAKVIGGPGTDAITSLANWNCLCGHNCASGSSVGDGNDSMESWGNLNFFCDANSYDLDTFWALDASASYHQRCGANPGDTCTYMDLYDPDVCATCRNW